MTRPILNTAFVLAVSALLSGCNNQTAPNNDIFFPKQTGLVSVGDGHTCATVNGNMACWGRGGSGQLGANYAGDKLTPTYVIGLNQRVAGVGAGLLHSCGIQGGAVKCWGTNTNGELGNGGGVLLTPGPTTLAGGTAATNVVFMATGKEHVCTLFATDTGAGAPAASPNPGNLKCWGRNDNGQVGNGGGAIVPGPVTPTGMAGVVVQAVAASEFHTCAVVNGGVFCWGKNDLGQLGNEGTGTATTPVAVIQLPAGSGVTAVAAGKDHSCAIINGGVKCWGGNAKGQLGDASTTTRPDPVDVAGLGPGSGVTQISAGNQSTCAVQGGAAKCWGFNGSAQLGNGTTTDSSVPLVVTGLGGGVTQIAAALNGHACAAVNGGFQCWGLNDEGQLGNNSTTLAKTPVVVLPF